jgi:hypothetical protein
MWILWYVALRITINIFFMRRWHCWKKSFGVCSLKSAKLMAWIFQEDCMWEETWNNKSLSQFKKLTYVKQHGIRLLVCPYQHTCYTKQIPSEDVDFYLMVTKTHINSKLQSNKWSQMSNRWLTSVLTQCCINWSELGMVDKMFDDSYMIHGGAFESKVVK